jgi:hypothetical protein
VQREEKPVDLELFMGKKVWTIFFSPRKVAPSGTNNTSGSD